MARSTRRLFARNRVGGGLAITVVCALGAAVPVSATPAPAQVSPDVVTVSEKAAKKFKLKTNRSTAIKGEPITFRGKLPQKGKRKLILQRKKGNKWPTVAKFKSKKNGKFSKKVAARSSTTKYRVLAPFAKVKINGAKKTLKRALSNGKKVTTLVQSVDFDAPARFEYGALETVQATFSPPRERRKVHLQRNVDGAWVNVRTGQQSKAGEVELRIPPADEIGAAETYRVQTTAANGAPAATSGGAAIIQVVPATKVGAGTTHSCAIRPEGSLWCWGDGALGRLGNGETSPTNAAGQISSAQTWSKVSSMNSHTCALADDRSAWCWGYNLYGVLGDATEISRTTPVEVAGGSEWIDISAGEHHTCGIKLADVLTPDRGTAWCWGYGAEGRTTNPGNADSSVPVQVGTATDWTSISAGGGTSCGVHATGVAECWGRGDSGQLGTGAFPPSSIVPVQVQNHANWTSLSVGDDHVCGIQDTLDLYCWGNAARGRLGNDSTSPNHGDPVQVEAGEEWVAVESSVRGTCALKADTSLWCWGESRDGQTGTGNLGDLLTPHQVAGTGWASADVGSVHGCGFNVTTIFSCWGQDSDGQLGLGLADPPAGHSIVAGPTGWTDIDAGASHTCGVSGGEAFCWGDNSFEQLGDGTQVPQTSPLQVGTDTDWERIDASTDGTCGLKSTGHAWCWGTYLYKSLGQVATGTAAVDWTDIDRVDGHGCGVVEGEVWCRGKGDNGQLGQGDTAHSLHDFQRVGTETDWTTVATAGYSTCGIRSGTLWCWGYNGNGELGGSPVDETVPNQVGTGTDWESVSAGRYRFCGLRDGGQLWCWGDGFGTPGDLPAQVGTAAWSQVDMNYHHACGVQVDGTAWCWGQNSDEQITGAPGANVPITAPHQIDAATDWVKVTAGDDFTCGIRSTGVAECWGDNAEGQHGDGTQAFWLEPQPVVFGS